MWCLSIISSFKGACFTERKEVQRGAGPRWAWERHGPPVGLSPSPGQVATKGRKVRVYLACCATWDS